MTDTKQLREWRASILAELETDLASLVHLQKRVRDAKQRLQHIDGLLSLTDRQTDEPSTDSVRTDDFLDDCEAVLSEASKPVHVRELRAKLLEKGVPLPGQGTEANLITRLHRSKDRFERTGRGTYAPTYKRAQGVMEFQDRTLMDNDRKRLTDEKLVKRWHEKFPGALHLRKQTPEGVFTYVRDIRRNFNQGTQGHGKRNDQGEIVGPSDTLSLPYNESGETYHYSERWLRACEKARKDLLK